MAGPSKGSKPDKIIRDALILELNRMTEDEDGQKIKKVNRVVHKLVNAAMDGKVDAIKEIFDRVDGKAPQALELSGELEHAYVARLPALSKTMDEWDKTHAAPLDSQTIQ